MKKWRIVSVVLSCILTAALMFTACGGGKAAAGGEASEEPVDYSDADNWLAVPEITKDVDTFYIYPTVYIDTAEDAPKYAAIDSEMMRSGAKNMYASQATVYEESTNVFAPYYRQANLAALSAEKDLSLDDFLIKSPRTDIYAALDYYFEKYNNGRPFILAGHSQGSSMTRMVLKEYMKEHPDYYKRMVAAYVLGYSITKKDLEDNPHLIFAEGADDTGVIVSWNIEGPGNKGENNVVVLDDAISINPINWARDDTYAPASDNLGSGTLNEKTGKVDITTPGLADAQVDTERGVVVCTNRELPFIKDAGNEQFAVLFGPESYHNGDYLFYYSNIQENVANRIHNYFLKQGKEAE